MIELELIKQVVEIESGIDDISCKSKIQEKVNARYIYFRLARTHTNKSTSKIGEVVNRDHATVLHGDKKCKNDLEANIKDVSVLYHVCNNSIINLKNNIEKQVDFSGLKDISSVIKSYEEKELKQKKKFHKELSDLKIINQKLSNRFKKISPELFKEISLLSDMDLEELHDRISVFLKVKKSLNGSNNKPTPTNPVLLNKMG